MKKYVVGFYYSLPIQLLLLHFRRYQVLLIFWYILFATIAGYFMRSYGADSLYLAPEYLGNVNPLSSAIVGVAIGIFIMSWNITTFILYSSYIKFLATTSQPFLKYCINNAIIPICFLSYYLVEVIHYDYYQELLSVNQILLLVCGFIGGFIFSVLIAFGYFFSADLTIYRSIATAIKLAHKHYQRSVVSRKLPAENPEIRVDWFLSAKLQIRKPRDVRHYEQSFLDSIFKRNHIAAVIAITVAFIFLIAVGFLSDNPVFQVPAAASITIFFAILIAVAGAVNLFLHSWSIPLVVLLYVLINWLYKTEVIDLRNKAYGLNYTNKTERASYDAATISAMTDTLYTEADKRAFIQTLNKWKAKQGSDKPVLVLINASGGGVRSATFTMNVLQRLDSVTHGKLMPKTVLLTGASGGMLGAAYFRALYWEQQKGHHVNLHDKKYIEDISKDLLNPLFSSFISRDLIGPPKKFSVNGYEYIKDRAYAFERQFNLNTRGLLYKRIGDYTDAEANAIIPSLFYNSVISRDGRKLIIGSRPARFLMQSTLDTAHFLRNDADALDFISFFHKQNPLNLSVLSALRMNATFPYALPNVWLPTNPVIDVMDAGLRDNFGQETSLRFIEVFKDWLKANTSKVVLIQIRDRKMGDWDKPTVSNSLLSFLTRPFLLLQDNWFKLQDYYQTDQLNYLYDSYGTNFYRISLQYVPQKKDANASLSFHLTASEKLDIAAAVDNEANKAQFNKAVELIK